jgi:membrane-bound lytic murein transglycosylase B
VLAGGLAAWVGLGCGQARAQDFPVWLEEFKGRAAAAGVGRPTLGHALRDLSPSEKVIELDRRQSSGSVSFSTYRQRAISRERIQTGARKLLDNHETLRTVRGRYGVAPGVVVALWGIESAFGSFTGGFPVINSLATLAWEGRRRELFERELVSALRIVERGDVSPAGMQGSWAGAMGQCQFMPSTYLAHGVDLDGDGKADIWRTVPDVLASIANYLVEAGWDPGYIWGREVDAPSSLAATAGGLEQRLPLARWHDLGVRRVGGGALPEEPITASLVRPDQSGPSFLVYDNFRTLMIWNRSTYFALAVGLLSDEIARVASA